MPLNRKHTNAIRPDVPEATFDCTVIFVMPLMAVAAMGRVNETVGAGAVNWMFPTVWVAELYPAADPATIVTGYVPVVVAAGMVTVPLQMPSIFAPEVNDIFTFIPTVPMVARTVETFDPYITARVEIVKVFPTTSEVVERLPFRR